MPRRIFTARDLAPIRAVTRQILERQPDAAVVAAAAAPIKRRIPTPVHQERTEVRLPVELERSTNPEGVPLHEIAKALRREVPGVTGVGATPKGLSLKFDQQPTPAQRRKIEALLSDRTRLERLKPSVRLDVRSLRTGGLTDEDALLRVLRDAQTSDAAWLRAFRRYAMTHLVQAPQPPGGTSEE